MKTSVDAVSGVERKITVEIPADEVDRRIEQEFTELRRMVPVRGFRKGKAPMEMVKRMFRDSVEAEVSEHLVKESLTEVVKEKDLKVLSLPGVDGAKVGRREGFRLLRHGRGRPRGRADGYKGIPVTREKVSVTDEDVSAAIERLRDSFAQFHAEEGRGAARSGPGGVRVHRRRPRAGDGRSRASRRPSCSRAACRSGRSSSGGCWGSNRGRRAPSRSPIPADFRNPKYAGKTVTFEVKVGGVREKKLPEMDDAFAKQFGDVSGVDELRAKVRERLVAEGEEHDPPPRRRRRCARCWRSGTLRRPRHAGEAPDDGDDAGHLRAASASQGVDLKKMNLDVDKMSERFAPNAERMVRVSLLIDAIARKENIEASFSEIDAEMKAMAEAQGMEYEKVREMYSSEERMDALRDRLLERKVLEFLMENAEVTEGAPE